VPTRSAIAGDAVPDATIPPFTVIVAAGSVEVGVTVTDATLFATLTAYETVVAEKVGTSVPPDTVSDERVATPTVVPPVAVTFLVSQPVRDSAATANT
jgi:hypothetical protein